MHRRLAVSGGGSGTTGGATQSTKAAARLPLLLLPSVRARRAAANARVRGPGRVRLRPNHIQCTRYSVAKQIAKQAHLSNEFSKFTF